jgi:hypothetical protein
MFEQLRLLALEAVSAREHELRVRTDLVPIEQVVDGWICFVDDIERDACGEVEHREVVYTGGGSPVSLFSVSYERDGLGRITKIISVASASWLMVLPSGNVGPILDVEGTQIRLIGGRVIDGVLYVSWAGRQGLP